jgi:hypothetical protein
VDESSLAAERRFLDFLRQLWPVHRRMRRSLLVEAIFAPTRRSAEVVSDAYELVTPVRQVDVACRSKGRAVEADSESCMERPAEAR